MTTAQQLAYASAILGALYLFTRRPTFAGDEPGYSGTVTVPPGAPQAVRRWRDDAVDAGRIYGVSPQLILAVIWKESTGVPSAVGDGGQSKGLMQVKDIAARDVGFKASTFASRANIQIGTAYLAKQIERMGGDVYDGLRAYNQGEAGARAGKGQAYAADVLRKAGWA